jgi:hypothetical protein
VQSDPEWVELLTEVLRFEKEANEETLDRFEQLSDDLGLSPPSQGDIRRVGEEGRAARGIGVAGGDEADSDFDEGPPPSFEESRSLFGSDSVAGSPPRNMTD